MTAMTEDVLGLVTDIVTPLVDFPEELDITASEDDRGCVFVDIRVNPDDAGKVIGRQGRIIKSIRTLARAAASRHGGTAEVELLD